MKREDRAHEKCAGTVAALSGNRSRLNVCWPASLAPLPVRGKCKAGAAKHFGGLSPMAAGGGWKTEAQALQTGIPGKRSRNRPNYRSFPPSAAQSIALPSKWIYNFCR
jgi:hypothetical protein